MPYSIETKDGITIDNIPDNIAPDAQVLKDRVAAIRAGGAKIAPPPSKDMGMLESLGEMITGTQRSTYETQTMPEWTSMPELNQMSMASFKTALGTMMSNPQETVQVLQANFPGAQIRQDPKGNFIIRSSVDQREYAIPPGFSAGDLPRVLGGLLAFTPAGRATTLPGAAAAGAGTQAVIEATQAGTGGRFDFGEVPMAGLTGMAGPVVQRAVTAAAPVVKRAAQRFTGPAATTAARAADQVPPVTPAAPPVTPAAPPPIQPLGTAGFVPEQPAEGVIDVLNLARKAGGRGPGSTAAKAQLVDLAQVNNEAREAAERLGMELPFDVFSDNPQVRSAVGLTRALVAGEAESAWEGSLRNAIKQADQVSQQFDAAFIAGRPATGATSQRILDSLKATQAQLDSDAKAIYQRVDDAIPKSSAAQFPRLTQTLDDVLAEVGETGLSAQEKKLYELATDPAATYGRLLREKNLIGKAMSGMDSPYGNMAAGDLKRLYAALADDQLTIVGYWGGEALRKELRGANLLTAKKKALESRIIGAFGKEIDGSVAQRMQTAIMTASKGDAAAFNRLMKVVPEDLQKETISTALAHVTAGKAAGRAADAAETVFSPSEFTKVYRGLRSNPPVYAQMVKIMGAEWENATRDLYEVSRRIADAQARIPVTGKANQILGNAAVDGLMGKVMSSSLAQRAATGAAGMVPGGGLVAPDIVQWMASSKGDGVQKAAKLFASPEFQELAVQAATRAGKPSQEALKRTAMSKAFSGFANAIKMPQSLDARVQWLQSAIQTERQFEQETQ